MKLLMIASAAGGSGKSTAVARLAESFSRAGIAPVIFDLSPARTAQFFRLNGIAIVDGRPATNPVALSALLAPYRHLPLGIVDTGSLHDEALETWMEKVDHLLLTTRIDAFSLHSLPGCWDVIDEVRRRHSSIKFSGILPVGVRSGEESSLRLFQRTARDFAFPVAIPWDLGELHASQLRHFEDEQAIAIPGNEVSMQEYERAARILAEKMAIEPVKTEPEKPTARGMIVNAWKKAAGLLKRGTTSQAGAA